MNVPAAYHAWILWTASATSLPDAILHIHAGLAILLIVRIVTRRSFASLIPLAAVVFAEIGNEVLDYLHHGLYLHDTLADIGNTLFWPLLISMGARLWPDVPKDNSAA